MWNADLKKPKNPQFEITEPILFLRSPANGGTSGPQACFLAEKGMAKVMVDKEQEACPLLRLSFLWESKLVAREQGRYAQKASAHLFWISDCGFRIFLVLFFNPHSAIYNPQFGGGPIGRPAGRPYNAITRFLGKERLARPVQERRALWYLRTPPLFPGRGTPEIQPSYA